jgi:6-phosphogluconolactonase
MFYLKMLSKTQMLAGVKSQLFKSKRTLCGCLAACVSLSMSNAVHSQNFLIGGYADGIYSSYIDAAGKMEKPKRVVAQNLPSFISIHPNGKYAYAVSESLLNNAAEPAQVVAYEIKWDAAGKRVDSLVEISTLPIKGDHPCFVAVDATGTLLTAANYSSGSLVYFNLAANGSLVKSDENNVIQHVGVGPNKARQEGPHAHCSVFDPSNKWLLAADLGADQVFVYPVVASKPQADPKGVKSLKMKPGSGPRHLSFHPNGKVCFVINELALTMTSASWDSKTGELAELQTLSTVPEGIDTAGFSTAEVLVHPNGRFVYGSNRGHNSIALFTFDEKTNKMQSAGTFPTGGKTPRNFRLTPDGKYLLAENQDSDSIYSFQIDPTTGALTSTGHSIAQKSPACIKFLDR